MNELRFLSRSEGDTERIGRAFARVLKAGDFVALYGGLGAGKTAFCRGVVSELGSDECASPTFTIVKEYGTRPPVFHFDAYRLRGEEELFDIGWEEYVSRPGVVLLEWPERVAGAIPKRHISVSIEGSGDEPRKIALSGLTDGAAAAIKEGAREYLVN